MLVSVFPQCFRTIIRHEWKRQRAKILCLMIQWTWLVRCAEWRDVRQSSRVWRSFSSETRARVDIIICTYLYVIYESSVATRRQSAMLAVHITPDMILEHNRKYVFWMKHIAIENHKTSKASSLFVGAIFVLNSICELAMYIVLSWIAYTCSALCATL